MRAAFTFSLVALVGCFSPNLEGVSFLCDDANPQCPAGYECAESRCFSTDNIPMTGTDPTPVPDGGTGMMGATGCASGMGFDVSRDQQRPVFACPGTFTADGDKTKNVNRLCATGFSICGDAMRVNLQACNALSTGFFVARSIARRASNSTDVQCMAPMGGTRELLWAGCGRNMGKDVFTAMCGGFSAARDCDLASSFGCYNNSLEGAFNKDAASGALCCK